MYNKSNQENYLSISHIAAIIVFIAVAVTFMFVVGCSGNPSDSNTDTASENDPVSSETDNADTDNRDEDAAYHRSSAILQGDTDAATFLGELTLGDDLTYALNDEKIDNDQLFAIWFVFTSEEFEDYTQGHTAANQLERIYWDEHERYAEELYLKDICDKVSKRIGADIDKRYLYFTIEGKFKYIGTFYVSYLTKGEIINICSMDWNLDSWGFRMDIAPEFVDRDTSIIDEKELYGE